MIESLIARAAPESAPAHLPDPPARVRQAAKQFEALLLAQILKSMHQAGAAGWLGGGEDQAGATATELAEEQFAQAVAQQGGLGLADLIASGINRA